MFFCDIVSYTEKTSLVNSSSLMKLIRSFEGIVFPVIREFRGQVVKTLGDGILAVFKHPLNATLCRDYGAEKSRGAQPVQGRRGKIFLRVGLNTGLVIRKQNDIFGDVVNIASRMQAAANPGDVLLTHDTYAEIQNYIGCTPLGKIKVKGKEEAIAAYAAQEVKVDFNHLLQAVKTGAPAPRKGVVVDPVANLKESMFVPVFAVPETLAVRPQPDRGNGKALPEHHAGCRGNRQGLPRGIRVQAVFAAALGFPGEKLGRHLANGSGAAVRAASS